MEWLSGVFAFTTGMCLLAAMAVLGARRNHNLRYLGVFFLLEGCLFLLQGLLVLPFEQFTALMMAAMMMLSLFVVPCLWLLLNEITFAQRCPFTGTLTKQEKRLLVLGIGLCLPLLSIELTWGWLQGPGARFEAVYGWVVHAGMVGAIAIFVIQAPHYYRRATQLLSSLPVNGHQKQPDNTQRLFTLLVVLLAAKWLVVIGRTLHCWLVAGAAQIDVGLQVAEVVVVPVALLLLARNCHYLNAQLNHSAAADTRFVDDKIPAKPGLVYRNSALSGQHTQRIHNKLQCAASQQSLICDSRLSLSRLSAHIGEPSYYVTQVLTQSLNSSFYAFVNEQRIGFATQLLADKPEMTILEIGYEVGFNSKSTFNTAFKRYTGMTPSEFRQQTEAQTQSVSGFSVLT